jgi:hypothetical protein
MKLIKEFLGSSSNIAAKKEHERQVQIVTKFVKDGVLSKMYQARINKENFNKDARIKKDIAIQPVNT